MNEIEETNRREGLVDRVENHLHGAPLGGLFGQGWRGSKCPRRLFYTYMVFHCIIWIVGPLAWAMILSPQVSPMVFHGLLITSAVTHTAVVIFLLVGKNNKSEPELERINYIVLVLESLLLAFFVLFVLLVAEVILAAYGNSIQTTWSEAKD